jgi:hypothetical protein
MFLVWIGDLAPAGGRLASSSCGCRCVAVALLLGAIEVIQIHLPGRVVESTDPLLVLMLAVTLGLWERLQNLRRNSLAR